MIFEILALLLGTLAGTITGLTPGIHINLISVLIISSAFLSSINPIFLAIFVIAMAITHTFLDFIPSIFLGSPDEDTGLSILPGHEFLLKGKGHEAIIHTLYGSAIAILIILILSPLFLYILPKIELYLTAVMFFIIIGASIFLLINEKQDKLLAIIIFLLAGFLGLSALNLPLHQPLLPLLTGLFGGSSLITSIIKKKKIPEQKISKLKNIKLNKKQFGKISLAAIISAPLCSFLPSLGSNQAAVIGTEVTGEIDRKEFLALLGAINTIVIGLSFITLLAINKTRTGAAVAISKLPAAIPVSTILITIFISGTIAFFLTIPLSKFFARKISKLNYRFLSIIIFLFLSIISTIFSGWLGLLIFLIATSLGFFTISKGIRRTHLMGCLMLPTIIFYLSF